MELPVIIVSDWSITPSHPIHYVRGENELDVKSLYKAVKALRLHAGRGVIKTFKTEPTERISNCTDEYLEHYWNLFARVIDYFADFAIHDNRVAQSVWFHLVDVLQDVAARLPHKHYKVNEPSCTHSSKFAEQYAHTVNLLVEVITNKPQESPVMDKVVRVNFALTREPVGAKGWIGGLKPWQQFLFNGSPGFRVSKKDLVYDKDDPLVPYLADKKVARHVHLPPAAIGIIANHTERLREATKQLIHDENREGDEAHILAEFDQHSFRPGESYSYTSMTGRTNYVQHLHPNRANNLTPIQHQGYGDPAQIVENPELDLINECVGLHRGQAIPRHPRGGGEFQMCTVTTLQEDQVQDGVKPVLSNLGEMFDDWKMKDEKTSEVEESVTSTTTEESDRF